MRNDKNYFVVQGWMVSELKLTGTDLLVYALIYGFSQDGRNSFYGSTQYIADTIGVSKRTVITTLQRLTENGILEKQVDDRTGVRYCHYRAVGWGGEKSSPVVKTSHKGGEKSSSGVVKNLHQGGEKSSPNIKDNNKEDIKEIDIGSNQFDYDWVVDLYHSHCQTAPKIKKLTEERKRKLKTLFAGFSKNEIEDAFKMAGQSSFLRGENSSGWVANFDFLIKKGNLLKVLEGNYKSAYRSRFSTETGSKKVSVDEYNHEG